jgi:hypothetical protein
MIIEVFDKYLTHHRNEIFNIADRKLKVWLAIVVVLVNQTLRIVLQFQSVGRYVVYSVV